jgi:hypothetical protein
MCCDYKAKKNKRILIPEALPSVMVLALGKDRRLPNTTKQAHGKGDFFKKRKNFAECCHLPLGKQENFTECQTMSTRQTPFF